MLGFGMQDLGAGAARQDTAGASAGAGRAGTAEAGPAHGPSHGPAHGPSRGIVEMWGSSFERHGSLSGGARRGSGAVALSCPASRASRSHPGRDVHFFTASRNYSQSKPSQSEHSQSACKSRKTRHTLPNARRMGERATRLSGQSRVSRGAEQMCVTKRERGRIA